jgi:acyl-CoA thioester hydrolase
VIRPVSALRMFVRVRFQECDPLGHVNNAVYVNFLEQAAIDHAALAGWPAARLQATAGAVFVARRHDISYLRPAFENDILEILTWPDDMSGARAFRNYLIHRIDGEPYTIPPSTLIDGANLPDAQPSSLVVRARTEWAFVDTARGRPVRIPQAVVHDFLKEQPA